MLFSVDGNFLSHESGTKFYEILRISNIDTGRSVLITRWGKIEDRHGGGQSKVEAFTHAFMVNNAFEKKHAEKSKRGYSATWSDYGLHDHKRPILDDDLEYALSQHYREKKVISRILEDLYIGSSFAEIEDEIEVICEEPTDRGSDWGSW